MDVKLLSMFIISLITFSSLISEATCSSLITHDSSFEGNKVDWGSHGIHAYRRQGGRGGRGAAGGGGNVNHVPTTRKSNASWLVHDCFFFVFLTFVFLVFQI